MQTYFITFTTYGTWLHGDDRGSFDPRHNQLNEAPLEPQRGLAAASEDRLVQASYLLDTPSRRVVDEAIRGVCAHHDWPIRALNVRTNHVHIVVDADQPPEKVMNAFKAWSTRRLREAGLVGDDRRVWTRHGSTRWVHGEHARERAVKYVLHEQGKALEGD